MVICKMGSGNCFSRMRLCAPEAVALFWLLFGSESSSGLRSCRNGERIRKSPVQCKSLGLFFLAKTAWCKSGSFVDFTCQRSQYDNISWRPKFFWKRSNINGDWNRKLIRVVMLASVAPPFSSLEQRHFLLPSKWEMSKKFILCPIFKQGKEWCWLLYINTGLLFETALTTRITNPLIRRVFPGKWNPKPCGWVTRYEKTFFSMQPAVRHWGGGRKPLSDHPPTELAR